MAEETTTTTTETTQTPAATWYTGKVDAETVGYLQNKGWADKDAATVALDAIKSHREAEKLIGAPANEVLRIPNPTDEVATKAFWQKLGAPANGKDGYDFTSIKDATGAALVSPTLDTVRDLAASLNLPKDIATRLAAGIVKNETDRATAAQVEKDAKLLEQKQALKTNWGANEAANLVVAQAAARALGVSPEAVKALEGVIGYDKVMEMFRVVGTKIGEDKFILNPNNPVLGVMTKEAATSRIAELKNDTAWVARYMAGGVAENREMSNLIAIQVG